LGCGGPTVVREETGTFVVAAGVAQDKVKSFYEDLAKTDAVYVATLRAIQPRGCPIDAECQQANPIPGLPGLIASWAISKPRDLSPLISSMECNLYRTAVKTLSGGDPRTLAQWIEAERRYDREIGPRAISIDDGYMCAIHLLGEGGAIEKYPKPGTRTILKLSDFKAELSVLSGYSDYLTALGRLAEDPKSDVSGEIEKAIGKFDQAQKLVQIPEGERTALSDSQKEKLDAITALVDQFLTLYKSKKQADEIRQLVLTNAAAFEADVRKLAYAVDNDYQALQKPIGEDNLNRITTLFRRGDAIPTVSERLTTLQLYLAAVESQSLVKLWEQEAVKNKFEATASPVGTILRSLAKAQVELANVAAGQFTPDQRNEAVKKTWADVKDTLRLVVNAVTLFL